MRISATTLSASSRGIGLTSMLQARGVTAIFEAASGMNRTMSLLDVSDTVTTFAARLTDEGTPRCKRTRSIGRNHEGSRKNEASWTVVTARGPARKLTLYWV